MKTYKGYNIFRADPNSFGIRWYCRIGNYRTLRADTLQGIKNLINNL